MCYDIKASLEAQLKRARRDGDLNAIQEIEKKLVPLTDLPIFHASGFSHPKLLIYTDASPKIPIVAQWGLVPHWVKDSVQLKKFWNNTLNARGETIFEKPAFRQSARGNRCLIYVDGFYEHHHYKGKTYPYYIHQKDAMPMILAGLWSEWVDRATGELWTTFSIVTTEGNPLLAKIHNNPKLKGPRMPLILPEDLADKWLMDIEEELDIQLIRELIHSFPEEELEAHTVHRLRGKDYMGNVAQISEKVDYPELVE
ncbi:SOS response-associated peptidase [Muriicola sp. Z0-33]|uniref:SOS response-associated peptidase n=1 Tax=Muriicola sp. Z0-33 TaxID=2816957 RepID=UPI00223763FA|nr:SOS response-associated peptidase [Muriicola sp. Z0-33]MCW5515944.1 SOS response-associated peptidase [Muriicola sp. Z0-33]